MKKLFITLSCILALEVHSQTSQYKFPVPKDVTNTPIYGALGLPVFGTATVTAATFADFMTVPLTGDNSGRQYRAICIYNPSSARELSVCFGSGCTTAQIKIPAGNAGTVGGGLCLDNVYFGFFNDITVIRAALDTTGSVTPEITIW